MEPDQKESIYKTVLADLAELFASTADPVARLSSTAAILHNRFEHFFWTGFYLLKDGKLVVGPYQGSIACVVLEEHRGVCWAGIEREEPIVVPNVHEFRTHIACDLKANSEIVVPLRDTEGQIIGVLDIDSADFDSFDAIDMSYLQQILSLITLSHL